jgi:hypothetical protein
LYPRPAEQQRNLAARLIPGRARRSGGTMKLRQERIVERFKGSDMLSITNAEPRSAGRTCIGGALEADKLRTEAFILGGLALGLFKLHARQPRRLAAGGSRLLRELFHLRCRRERCGQRLAKRIGGLPVMAAQWARTCAIGVMRAEQLAAGGLQPGEGAGR